MSDDKGSFNHGIVVTGEGATKINQAFGKDSSDYVGSKAAERGKKLGGGVTDLSHSLSGASAVQGSKK